MIRFLVSICFGIFVPFYFQAQILDISPTFPSADDVVEIIYDATQGNGALEGASQIYAHTGVITSNSSNPNDWQHVVGEWGTPDNDVIMESLGNNLHRISYSINDFYNILPDEEVYQMAFVFRNADGSLVGRDTDGSDIFTPVYGSTGLFTAIIEPSSDVTFLELNETFTVSVATSEDCTIEIFNDGVSIATTFGNMLETDISATSQGVFNIQVAADNGIEQATDEISYVVPNESTILSLPSGTQNGLTYINDNVARFKLTAPQKPFVYLIGDFNDWTISDDYQLFEDGNGSDFWIEIDNLSPDTDYAYQYVVGENLKIADPHSEIILDPWNDQYINSATYPNLPSYPAGLTTGNVSVFKTNPETFNWTIENFDKPDKTNLVIYELLIRDFFEEHNYQTLVDTLSYFENLGVTAIELMPINEFEGNDSWGYNPSFHQALDKYYGTKQALKTFVDEAHARGIAVILDVVYNHAFSQSPLCQMFWNSTEFRPSSDNPWLNEIEKHPYNVGYDFNHISPYTRSFTKYMLTYWMDEFKIDGFRFDLSKGFTQTNSLGNEALFGEYDVARINTLKHYADHIWSIDEDAYVILEHFAENAEEIELAAYGFMLWGNMNYEYNEATMGYPSNLNWGVYSFRGWNAPHLITYMESHDEERLMYKNIQYGNSNGSYDIKDPYYGLQRNALAATFFFPLPGPKMIWQFGELGYDESINYDCRTCPKPIKWEYYDDPNRKNLFNVYKALIHLKNTQPAFQTDNFAYSLAGSLKSIQLNHSDQNFTIIGNFGMNAAEIDPQFQFTGTWYDYFNQTAIEVTDVIEMIELEAGEYIVFSDEYIPLPDNLIVGLSDLNATLNEVNIYPSIVENTLNIQFETALPNVEIMVYDVQGKIQLKESFSNSKDAVLNTSKFTSGTYYIQMLNQDQLYFTGEFVKQ